jgi:hypothetical protein
MRCIVSDKGRYRILTRGHGRVNWDMVTGKDFRAAVTRDLTEVDDLAVSPSPGTAGLPVD